MRTLILGIDSGTQSTKVLVLDAGRKKVVATAAIQYGLIPGLAPGAKEQHPRSWVQATSKAIAQALKAAKATAPK